MTLVHEVWNYVTLPLHWTYVVFPLDHSIIPCGFIPSWIMVCCVQAVREYEEREKRIKALDKEASCSTQLSLSMSLYLHHCRLTRCSKRLKMQRVSSTL